MPEGFGFKAWISTGDDNEALQEYGVETDLERREVRCWIPSQAGKKFKVVWRNKTHFSKDTVGNVTLDGNKAGGIIVHKSNLAPVFPSVKESVVTSNTSARKFVFSSLKLTDDDSLLRASHAKNIGSISLDLHEVKVGQVVPTFGWTVDEENTVHERSKKGVVHKVGFAPNETKIETTRHVDYMQQFGTFVFRYRPIDVLQAQGIAPRDAPPQTGIPSETDTGSKRKADAIDAEDLDESDDEEEAAKELACLRARIRDLEVKHKKTKRAKKEPLPVLLPGEVIDLT